MITVKELARGLKRPVDEVIALIEASGMGKVDEDSVLRNSQAMILYDIIKKKRDRRNERLRFDREQQNTFNRLMDADMIFIDTCSLLKPQAELFWDRAESILRKRQAKIIIPFSVIREMWKHTDNPEKPGLQDFANHALERIEELTSQGLVEISGEESDCLADQTFMKLIEKYRFDRQILLITEDMNLSIDALNRNQTRSSTFIPMKVANIRFDGYLKQQNLQDLEIRALKKEAREAREEEMKRERERGNSQKNEAKAEKEVVTQGQSYCSVCGRDMTKENARLIRKGKEPHSICNRCYYKEKNEQKEKPKENLPIKKTVREQRREPGYIGTVLSDYKGLGPGSKEFDSLRVFYNGWLSRKEAGKRAADLYYLNLYNLEEGLQKSERREEIMKMLWKGYLSPAIKAIKRFEYRSADKKLKGMTKRLAELLDVDLILPEGMEESSTSEEATAPAAEDAKAEDVAEESVTEAAEPAEETKAEDTTETEKPERKNRSAKSDRKRSKNWKNEKKTARAQEAKTPDETKTEDDQKASAEASEAANVTEEADKPEPIEATPPEEAVQTEADQEQKPKEEAPSEEKKNDQPKKQNRSSGNRSGKSGSRNSQNRKNRNQSGNRRKTRTSDQSPKKNQQGNQKSNNRQNQQNQKNSEKVHSEAKKNPEEVPPESKKVRDQGGSHSEKKNEQKSEQKSTSAKIEESNPKAQSSKAKEEKKQETAPKNHEVKAPQTPASTRKTASRTRVSQKKTTKKINPITRWIPRRKKAR